MLPHGLPIAQLQTVRLDLLRECNSVEAQKLLEACQTDGYFYLDIRNVDVDFGVLDRMYELCREIFSLPLDDKLLYDVDKLSSLKLNG
jgi:isopenicillin N synthase-like dioxygenase